jgi:hypothetical protein
MAIDHLLAPDTPETYLRPTELYDISDAQVSILVHNLLAERPPLADSKFVCYQLGWDDPASDVARHVERVVFEKHFKNNDAEKMREEYGPYEHASLFFLTIDQTTKEPVGAIRIIKDSDAGLKVFNDAEAEEQLVPFTQAAAMLFHDIESLDDTWEVGTVAVMPTYRKTDAAVQLYRAMFTAAVRNEVEHFVAAIDTRPLKKMTDYLGIPFVPLLETKPFEYLGSATTQLVYGHVPDFYPQMSRRRHTIKGWIARKALDQLVFGKNDDAIQH